MGRAGWELGAPKHNVRQAANGAMPAMNKQNARPHGYALFQHPWARQDNHSLLTLEVQAAVPQLGSSEVEANASILDCCRLARLQAVGLHLKDRGRSQVVSMGGHRHGG